MKPATSWFLVGFVSAAPQRELQISSSLKKWSAPYTAVLRINHVMPVIHLAVSLRAVWTALLKGSHIKNCESSLQWCNRIDGVSAVAETRVLFLPLEQWVEDLTLPQLWCRL